MHYRCLYDKDVGATKTLGRQRHWDDKDTGEIAMGSDSIIERKVFPEGVSIFKEGDPGSTAYIIQEGLVGLHKTIDGEEKILAKVSKGAIFGEMALIDKSPRAASARALEPTTVIVINEAMFSEKMKKTDPFIRGLLGILADTVRNQNG